MSRAKPVDEGPLPVICPRCNGSGMIVASPVVAAKLRLRRGRPRLSESEEAPPARPAVAEVVACIRCRGEGLVAIGE